MSISAGEFDVAFLSTAMGEDDLFVRRMTGSEALSKLFKFEIFFEVKSGEALTFAQFDAILAGRAMIAFGSELMHRIHGVVRHIDAEPSVEGSPPQYRVTFVPALFDTTMTRGSWVFQDMTVEQIVADVLGDAGFVHNRDFVFRLAGRYEKSEYTVQYNETDFDFIARLCEHAGIFFYFQHGESHARVVFADSNAAFGPLEGFDNIVYDSRGGTTGRTEVMTGISASQSVIPKQVLLRDFNYRTPGVPLLARQAIDEAGVGLQVLYGEHFKTPDEGRRIARLRSEEWVSGKRVYRAGTRVRGLRAGHAFVLEDMPITELGQKYAVVAVTHRASQSHAASDAKGEHEPYSNELMLISHATPFRPERTTPKPRIHGVTHAMIDAPGDDGVTAPIDDHGRYKVVLPWDVGARSGGKASRWIRMAQPSSGAGYGVHFPLHAGTEVLLIHVDGDPDRPVIIASVPNTVLHTPVTAANATQSMMRTRTGITVTFDDAAPGATDD